MLHYATKDLTQKQAYKFLSGSIIPRPIAWVTTFNKDQTVINAAPFSFFNAAAADIPLITLSILRQNGATKDTAQNILDTKELVIHLVDERVVEAMNQTAASIPSDQSELLLNRIETTPSKSVRVPGIKNARIRMEGHLHQYIPIKNHTEQLISDLFIVEITDFYFDDTIFDQKSDYILADVFRPIARLAGQTYAKLSGLFDLKRPD